MINVKKLRALLEPCEEHDMVEVQVNHVMGIQQGWRVRRYPEIERVDRNVNLVSIVVKAEPV
jgi:predicted thioesterase